MTTNQTPSTGIRAERRLRSLLHQIVESGEMPLGPITMLPPDPPVKPGKQAKGMRPSAGHEAKHETEFLPGIVSQPETGLESERPRWPTGPVVNGRPFDASLVEQVMTMLVADPAAGMGVDHPMMQRVMLESGCDGPTIGRYAVPLLLWLAESGVITQVAEAEPWTQPCRLSLADTDAIRAALQRTRRPTTAEIEAAKQVIKRIKAR